MKLSVVIPVYNEVNTILEVLRRVQAVPIPKEIIVVDDGSTDGTKQLLREVKENNIRIILNQENRGKGFSVRRGFDAVTGDIVIIQDADLEYYPDEYPILIQKIIEGKADVVYGTRFLGARRVFHFYHYLGNKLLNLAANILYDTNLSDLMTCYKVFRSNVLKTLKLRANRFGIEAEITGQLFKRRLRVYEVPISYDGRTYDEGKKTTWRDFFRSLYWLIRCKFETLDVGEDTLLRMKLMKNNNRWIFEQLKPYLGDYILEIGSGIANISRYLVSLDKHFILTDTNEYYLQYLRHAFVGNPRVHIMPLDLLSADFYDRLPFKIDTILCINVLEHIIDDDLALENINETLDENGRLFLLVPASQALFGSLDEKLNHFRRYNRQKLSEKIRAKGFTIDKLYYHNFLGALGWYLNGRLLKRKTMSSLQIQIFDKCVFILSKLESSFSIPFGLSLIAVCTKNKSMRA
jgi:glycosyltransferase involved in cell wall biosynthesis